MPAEFVIAERFGWTLDYIAGLPSRTFLDLVAYVRITNEWAKKTVPGR